MVWVEFSQWKGLSFYGLIMSRWVFKGFLDLHSRTGFVVQFDGGLKIQFKWFNILLMAENWQSAVGLRYPIIYDGFSTEVWISEFPDGVFPHCNYGVPDFFYVKRVRCFFWSTEKTEWGGNDFSILDRFYIKLSRLQKSAFLHRAYIWSPTTSCFFLNQRPDSCFCFNVYIYIYRFYSLNGRYFCLPTFTG